MHSMRPDVCYQISRGVEALYKKLQSEFPDTIPAWTGMVECSSCSQLALCASRLVTVAKKLQEQPIFRETIAKLRCTLFQVSTHSED